MSIFKKLVETSKAAGEAAVKGARSVQASAAKASAALEETSKKAQAAQESAAAKKIADAHALLTKKLSGPTNNFTKAMVVRTYSATETQLMEDEGSVLIDQGYVMQGQSGFAENEGESWTSIKSANRSKGTTTITFRKSK